MDEDKWIDVKKRRRPGNTRNPDKTINNVRSSRKINTTSVANQSLVKVSNILTQTSTKENSPTNSEQTTSLTNEQASQLDETTNSNCEIEQSNGENMQEAHNSGSETSSPTNVEQPTSPKSIDSVSPENTPDQNIDDGSSHLLPQKYVFWAHDVHNKSWSLDSYQKVCTVETISDFWKLCNNLPKIFNRNHLFFMKEGIDPIWEHPINKNGGFCSFKTELNTCLPIFEDLCTRMVCHKVIQNQTEINGISMSSKYNSAIIKIWNRNCDFDLVDKLDPDITEKYKDCSIKYIKNVPEY